MTTDDTTWPPDWVEEGDCDSCGEHALGVADNYCPHCGEDFVHEPEEEIELSEDQKEALAAVLDAWPLGQVAVLTGPAGSGKTTLTRKILQGLQRYAVLGAPTGKAAYRLAEVTGREAHTIHKLLYGEVREVNGVLRFGRPSAPCGMNDALIIDEASMLGTKVYNELMDWVPSGAKVLFIGDREQLEPVNDDWGPNLKDPTAALTQVHRQAAGNPIIGYATAIRERRGDQWSVEEYDPDDVRLQVYDGTDSAIHWYLAERERDRDVTLITYTHRIRRLLNERIRNELGLTGVVAPGDRMVVKANNYAMGLMNGEVVTVTHVDDIVPSRAQVHIEECEYPLLVNLDLVEASSGDFWRWKKRLPRRERDPRMTLLHYGSCLTVHSSQGSQWDSVGFVWDAAFKRMRSDKKDEARRLLYTAVTRAAEHLTIFMV